jgi:protein SCO1/2
MLNCKTLGSIVAIIALIGFGVSMGIFSARQNQDTLPPNIPGLLWPQGKALQAFSMDDQNDNEFDLNKLSDKWSFLFFGYTSCPDICPITMTILDQLYLKLGTNMANADVQMIFVSVDPIRDNSEKLKAYVSYFNKDFFGLGGSIEQIKSLTGQIGISFIYEQADSDGNYLIGHTSSIFLIDPQGQMRAIFSQPHLVDDILSRFLKIRTLIEKESAS